MWLISEALMRECANSPSSPAPVAEFWLDTFSDGTRSAQSNGNPTQLVYLPSDRMTDYSLLSRSGMTCKSLTENLGEVLLTWFRVGFPALPSARPVKVEGLQTVLHRDFGRTWHALSMRYSRDACLWKTRPSLLDEGWISSLPTLPRWGSMLNGELWQRRTLVRLTNEIESGSLPTPVKWEAQSKGPEDHYKGLGWQAKHFPGFSRGEKLSEDSEIKLIYKQRVTLPTKTQITVTEERMIERMSEKGRGGTTAVPLNEHVQREQFKQRVRIETPSSQNGLRGGSGSANQPMMVGSPGDEGYGELNPEWVEWLMNWPIGWTSLEPIKDPIIPELWQRVTKKPTNGDFDSLWWQTDPSDDGSIPRTCEKGLPARVKRIAALGNGQVPAAAAAAFLHLYYLPFPGEQK